MIINNLWMRTVREMETGHELDSYFDVLTKLVNVKYA